jgi:hypothetical protein
MADSMDPAYARVIRERHEAERAALTERHEAERTAAGLDVTPIATWNAFAPDQLAGVITGVTRCDASLATKFMAHLAGSGTRYEFTIERRDLAGVLIGGARWRIERHRASLSWCLHLLETEPEGVA